MYLLTYMMYLSQTKLTIAVSNAIEKDCVFGMDKNGQLHVILCLFPSQSLVGTNDFSWSHFVSALWRTGWNAQKDSKSSVWNGSITHGPILALVIPSPLKWSRKRVCLIQTRIRINRWFQANIVNNWYHSITINGTHTVIGVIQWGSHWIFNTIVGVFQCPQQ